MQGGYAFDYDRWSFPRPGVLYREKLDLGQPLHSLSAHQKLKKKAKRNTAPLYRAWAIMGPTMDRLFSYRYARP